MNLTYTIRLTTFLMALALLLSGALAANAQRVADLPEELAAKGENPPAPDLDDPEFRALEAEAAKKIENLQMPEPEKFESGPEPMLDFAGISNREEELLGTISMIDGNQAVFVQSGVIVSGTGRFLYKAQTEKGLYLDFFFDYAGTEAHGGVYVDSLIIEFKSEGEGLNALHTAFVHSIFPANDEFDFAFTPVFAEETQNVKTTYKNLRVCNGLLYLTPTNLMGPEQVTTYRGVLHAPLQGRLEAVSEATASSDCSS